MPILCRKNAEKATGKTGRGKRIGMARLRVCSLHRASIRMNRPVASAAAIPAQPAGREENVAAVSDRPVGGAFNGRKALVHRCTCLTCHSEERSDVGISQNTAGQLGSHRRNRNCLPEIATGAKRPRNNKSGSLAALKLPRPFGPRHGRRYQLFGTARNNRCASG